MCAGFVNVHALAFIYATVLYGDRYESVYKSEMESYKIHINDINDGRTRNESEENSKGRERTRALQKNTHTTISSRDSRISVYGKTKHNDAKLQKQYPI